MIDFSVYPEAQEIYDGYRLELECMILEQTNIKKYPCLKHSIMSKYSSLSHSH